jgi:dipeptidyl aminopeptidase/acylaminoacyl peptidase
MRPWRGLFLPVLLLLLGTTSLAAQHAEIAPTENLVVEQIPRVPASLAADVDRYANFRRASLSSWHPTKREMLISTRFADTAQVHHVKFPGGDRTQLTFFRDGVSGASYHPAGGDYFVFNKDIGGNEFYQTYRFDFATGATALLTDGASRNTGGVWTTAGDRLANGSTRRNGQDVDLWVMNPADPTSDRLVARLQGGGWGAFDWSPDDRTLLAREYVSINETHLWLIDVATGAGTRLTEKDGAEPVAYFGAQFSRDGQGVYVTTDRGSEFRRLAYIDLATKRHTFLTAHIRWDVDEFRLSRDGTLVAFVTNEEGGSVLHLLDLQSGRERPVPKLPLGLLGGLRWHRVHPELGFTLTSARSAADAYSLDVTTGRVERWTHSETGGVSTESFTEPRIVRWKSFDGLTISGLLYRPPKRFAGKRPVIVDIHGGPEAQARPGFQGARNYFLNELGVAILYPNVRGSAGYGKTFLTLDNGFLREHAYRDIGALLDWIAAHEDLDAERVMVTGGSYGGHMTLAVATYYPDRIRAALDVVGPSNLVTFLESTAAYRRDLRRVEYGDERDPKMREFLNRIAPTNNSAKITRPLFVVQGANDPRVPRSESEQMVAAVRKNGTPVWYLMAKDEGHGFAKKANRDFLLYATVLFVKEYLLK